MDRAASEVEIGDSTMANLKRVTRAEVVEILAVFSYDTIQYIIKLMFVLIVTDIVRVIYIYIGFKIQ